jgi:hypothetical protein
MPIRVENVDPRKSGSRTWPDDHLLRIAIGGIFSISVPAQKLDGLAKNPDTHGKVDVLRVDFVAAPERGVAVRDQMQLLPATDAKPSARKRKIRPGNLLEP